MKKCVSFILAAIVCLNMGATVAFAEESKKMKL